MEFWRSKWHQLFSWVSRRHYSISKDSTISRHDSIQAVTRKKRSLSSDQAVATRNAQLTKHTNGSPGSTRVSLADDNGRETKESGNIARESTDPGNPKRPVPTTTGESAGSQGKESGGVILPVSREKLDDVKRPEVGRSPSWWEKILRRKKDGFDGSEHDV